MKKIVKVSSKNEIFEKEYLPRGFVQKYKIGIVQFIGAYKIFF